MIDLFALVVILVGLVVLLGILLLISLRRAMGLHQELSILRQDFEAESKRRIGQSKAVILGQVAEQFAPYLADFPWNPKDARFLGSPIDFVVFDGLTNSAQSTPGSIREIIFVEVKTASSQLSTNERAIRQAISAGQVRFVTLRIEPGKKIP
jgi:predicted Holliday junction resolvase-like endonuclease